MNDAELQAYRAAYRRSLEEQTVTPPTDDELAALVTGEITDSERDRIVSVLLRSPEAIEDYRILKELHQAARRKRGRRRGWIRGLSAVAGLVFAVSVGSLALQGPRARERGPDVSAANPSGNVLLLEAPEIYRWSAQVGARRYRVRIFDNEAEVLWQSSWVVAPELPALGPDQLRLTAGGRYFWTVEVEGAGGRRELGPYWFRLD